MATAAAAFGLTTNALIFLAIMQCTTQGILIPLLTTFLSSESDHRLWFKIYVVCVNVFTAGQTVTHVLQVFDVIGLIPASTWLVGAPPILTGVIGASVQVFFIQRCWKIYHQRILPTIPLLLLCLTSFVTAITIGYYAMELANHGPVISSNTISGLQVSSTIWGFSSLILDTITTFSTIVYLYRVRKNLGGGHSVFVMVWQIMWTSATPPLILMVISVIDGCIVYTGPRLAGILSTALTAKFFVLSLMVNLVGQKHIREQFERRRTHPSPSSNLRSQSTGNRSFDPAAIQITASTPMISSRSQ
ncbi:unnamed protein product [Rhizoctonia solani]|uniref:Uncharacterized protein n=1 Tax=Rhizoctonia solani TaxID=456999 RepID=A0A8H3CBS8_9AGAM|nr:unnamed protein product [Rhizoctonia solani]